MREAFGRQFSIITCPRVLVQEHEYIGDSHEWQIHMVVRYLAMTVEGDWFYITGRWTIYADRFVPTRWLWIETFDHQRVQHGF